MQEIKRKGGRVLGLVNVVGSAIARECDGGIYLHAGPEVVGRLDQGVHLDCWSAFALLALHLGRVRDLSPADGRARSSRACARCPGQIEEILDAGGPRSPSVAAQLAGTPTLFFVGRVRGYPVAREGAQKLKEISYVHAEAYPASELKHGPLALIGPELPTVAIVPDDELLDKNLSRCSEIRRPRRAGHRRRTPCGATPGLADDRASSCRRTSPSSTRSC